MDERTYILSDPDIWQSAWLLVQAHGENAPHEAEQKAERALEDGFLEVVAIWRRILKACHELLHLPPIGSNALN